MNLPEATLQLCTLHAAFPFLEGSTLQGGVPAFPRSFRVHLAAMLNQYCAGFFDPGINRMAIAFSANTPRSGKSLLAKMGLITVHGWPKAQTLPMTDRSRCDETELRKIIDAAVATGAPYLFFDNVRGHIESQALEAFLTVPVWTGRVFGSNTKTFTAENSCTLVITGNDLNLGPDLRNRFLFCDLFVAEAEASERTIRNPIEDHWIYHNRQILIDCLQTLVENWDAKGRPGLSDRVRPGFETWCHRIGGIIEAAGMGSILEEPKLEASGSKEEQDARALAVCLAAELSPAAPEKQHKVADLANLCFRNGWFAWALDGREEVQKNNVDDTETLTIKLSPKGRAMFGGTLKRYAPHNKDGGSRALSRTWALAPGKLIRLHSTGQEHAKRIIATLEITPRAVLNDLITHHSLTRAFVESHLGGFSTTDLDALHPHELQQVIEDFDLIAAQPPCSPCSPAH